MGPGPQTIVYGGKGSLFFLSFALVAGAFGFVGFFGFLTAGIVFFFPFVAGAFGFVGLLGAGAFLVVLGFFPVAGALVACFFAAGFVVAGFFVGALPFFFTPALVPATGFGFALSAAIFFAASVLMRSLRRGAVGAIACVRACLLLVVLSSRWVVCHFLCLSV